MTSHDILQTLVRQIDQIPLQTREEQIETFQRLKSGDESARDLLINSNLRLALKAAFSRKASEADEVLEKFECAVFGLMTAVDKFDVSLGYAFSTYANPWINQTIQRFHHCNRSTIRVPVHMIERRLKILRVSQVLEAKLHRLPTSAEIAESLELSVQDVEKAQKVSADPVSLDYDYDSGSDSSSFSLHDVLTDDGIGPEEIVERKTSIYAIREAIEELSPVYREVIMRRFGFETGEPETLDAIGEDFGRTRERIRQIEVLAKKQLKVLLQRKGIHQLDDLLTDQVA